MFFLSDLCYDFENKPFHKSYFPQKSLEGVCSTAIIRKKRVSDYDRNDMHLNGNLFLFSN
jgi:hypothetical protein